MEERGKRLEINFNRGRKWSSNSYLALQAAEFAMEYGDMWRFHRRMFKAYFDDLEDIGVIENVVRIGADAGLNADELRKALEDGRYRQRVDEGINWSRGIGVTAIPTFVFNERWGMVGAQEIEAFRQMMTKIGQPRKDQPASA